MAEDLSAMMWARAKELPGVKERTSEGADLPALFVGRIEFLHLHGTTMDLRLPPPLQAAETARGDVRRHHVEDAARDGWVEIDLRATSADRVQSLVAMAHEGAARLSRT